MDGQKKCRPHALLLPFPAQGHINPFAQLAQILLQNNFFVTFITTEFIYYKLNPICDENLRFVSFPDGLPPDHARLHDISYFCVELVRNSPPHIDRIVKETRNLEGFPPPSVFISDTMFSFARKIADKHGFPSVHFRTTSACGFSAYFHMSLLIERGFLPVREEKDLQRPITCIPTMESLRVGDLPSFALDSSDPLFGNLLDTIPKTRDATLVLINTWEDLEKPVIDHLNSSFSGKVTAIGPVLLMAPQSPLNSSLWMEESSCLQWLDTQKPGLVLFVSFGSLTVLTQDELLEFAWGLEASSHPFLWVIRPDLLEGSSAIFPKEFVEKTRGRAHFASWVDQKKVLGHESVGGFLTHSGWNSVLESICAGVAMICWSFFAEQPTNRRFVSKVWNVGFEMDEIVERERVASVVKKLMDSASEEGMRVKRNAMKMKQSAVDAVLSGGSSRRNLQRLLDIVNAA